MEGQSLTAPGPVNIESWGDRLRFDEASSELAQSYLLKIRVNWTQFTEHRQFKLFYNFQPLETIDYSPIHGSILMANAT